MATEQKTVGGMTKDTVPRSTGGNEHANTNTQEFEKAYATRQQNSQNYINNQLDSSKTANNDALKTAYESNQAAQSEATQKGQQAYETAKADTGTQATQNKRGMDSFADARNLNYQQGSQQAMSLNRAQQSATGNIVAKQNAAMLEAERQQQQITTNYKNLVAEALANSDYRRASALFDDYNNQNTWLENNAATLASYGNFSGYAALYGAETANSMKDYWVASNPEIAYNTGVITAEQYKEMTGLDTPDYTSDSDDSESGSNNNNNWWYTPEATRQGYTYYGNYYGYDGAGTDASPNGIV